MTEDPRCCGSGTCIINNDGLCWCGQQWDGQKMCQAPLAPIPESVPGRATAAESSVLPTGSD